MGRNTIGQAKNVARRALRAIVDAEQKPKEVARIWDYFASTCAYCGLNLTRGERKGHIDHLKNDGPNHISNRVLSCGKCNGDEKRERDWLEFLKSKVPDARERNKRRERILQWVEENTPEELPDWRPQILLDETKKLMKAFDRAAGRLRSHRDSKG